MAHTEDFLSADSVVARRRSPSLRVRSCAFAPSIATVRLFQAVMVLFS